MPGYHYRNGFPFVYQQRSFPLISPEDITNTRQFEQQVYDRIKALMEQQTRRVDILSIICTRLVNYLLINK